PVSTMGCADRNGFVRVSRLLEFGFVSRRDAGRNGFVSRRDSGIVVEWSTRSDCQRVSHGRPNRRGRRQRTTSEVVRGIARTPLTSWIIGPAVTKNGDGVKGRTR